MEHLPQSQRGFMKTLIILISLLGAVFLFGCYQHDYMIYTPNRINVENQTGQALDLVICSKSKSAFSEESITKHKVQIPSQGYSDIYLGSNSRHEIKRDESGGFDYVNSDDVNYLNFSIENSSFNLVKLCINEISKENILLDKNTICPMGTQEQVSPALCN